MKHFIISVMLVFLGQWTFAQKINKADVPASVINMFLSKVPDSLPATWEKKDANYIAHFVKNSLKAIIQISDKSEWILTQWDLPADYLPAKVKKYIAEHYAGYKTIYAKVEYKPGSEFYLAGIKKKKDTIVLRFSVKSEFTGVEPTATQDKPKDKTIQSKKTPEK